MKIHTYSSLAIQKPFCCHIQQGNNSVSQLVLQILPTNHFLTQSLSCYWCCEGNSILTISKEISVNPRILSQFQPYLPTTFETVTFVQMVKCALPASTYNPLLFCHFTYRNCYLYREKAKEAISAKPHMKSQNVVKKGRLFF